MVTVSSLLREGTAEESFKQLLCSNNEHMNICTELTTGCCWQRISLSSRLVLLN